MRRAAARTIGRVSAAALAVALAALAGGLLAEGWVGAASLPRWLPPAPYPLARALHALPFTHSTPWEWARRHVAAPVRPRSSLPDPALGLQPSQSGLSAGSYLGWTDGAAGGLTLYGHACTPADPPVGVSLAVAGREVRLGADAIATLELDIGTYYPAPVTRLSGALPAGDYAPAATVRCRSGAEARHPLGAVRVAQVAPNPAGLLIDAWAAPLVGVYSHVALLNPGPDAVTLTRLEYAPAAAATSVVLAYLAPAGSVARLEDVVGDGELLERLAADPHGLEPVVWPAASARDLALRLPAGGSVLLIVHAASFHATQPRLPALFHPAVSYELDDGTQGGVTATARLSAGWTAR